MATTAVDYNGTSNSLTLHGLDKFVELIRAEERESCAKLCDDLRDCEDNPKAYRNGAGWCGERIRARGEVK